MSDEQTHSNPDESDRGPTVSRDQAANVLDLGVHSVRRPVDDVIDRLARPDGAAWLERIGGAWAPWWPDAAADQVSEETVGLESLRSMKGEAKRRASEALSRDDADGATVMYFLTVGLALALHRTNLSSRGGDALRDSLIDLAEVCPQPWSEILREGAVALVESMGNEGPRGG